MDATSGRPVPGPPPTSASRLRRRGRYLRTISTTPRPLVWLLVCFSFWYVRWESLVPPLAVLRLGGLITYGMALWFFLKGDKTILWKEPLVTYCAAFVFLMILSCTFAVHVSAIFLSLNMFLALFALVVPVVNLVTTWERAVLFFKCWIAINLYVAVWAILHKGKGTGDFLLDENDLALAMAMVLPYGVYLRYLSSNTSGWKFIYTLTAWASAIAIVVSFSRGGFVGLVAVSLALWIFSKRKLRIALIAVLSIGLGGSLAAKLLPAGYITRIQSASNPDNSTRVERLQSWQVGWIMWKHNPIFGTGAGQFPWNVDKYEPLASFWINSVKSRDYSGRQVHSLYLALLSEMGLAGTTVFLLLTGTIVITLLPIATGARRRAARAPPPGQPAVVPGVAQIEDQALLAKALLCSLVGFLSSGAFLSVLYYPHIWLLAAFTAVLKNCARTTAGGENPPQSGEQPPPSSRSRPLLRRQAKAPRRFSGARPASAK
jgi:O-antigen ligase